MSKDEKKKYKVLRVTQLDSEQIQYQIFNLLKGFVLETLKSEPFTFLLKFEPEVGACLQLVLWNFSIRKHGSHFGQSMLGTEFRSGDDTNRGGITRGQKYSFVLYITMQWLKHRERWILRLIDHLFKSRRIDVFIYMQKLFTHLETLVKVLSFLNMLQFMRASDHVTLLQRVANLKHYYTGQPYPRYIDYQYMRKQMVWDAVSKTILCVLPFVNFQKMFYIARILWMKTFKRYSQNAIDGNTETKMSMLCGICNQLATNPCCGIKCQHVFCYYCLERSKVDRTFICAVCGEKSSVTLPIVYEKSDI